MLLDYLGLVNQTEWMEMVNVQDAKTGLSKLLSRVEAGEQIILARAGRPVARLIPTDPHPPRRFGPMSFSVPDGFDAPLPSDEVAAWE